MTGMTGLHKEKTYRADTTEVGMHSLRTAVIQKQKYMFHIVKP
jgi:hypothetical protein